MKAIVDEYCTSYIGSPQLGARRGKVNKGANAVEKDSHMNSFLSVIFPSTSEIPPDFGTREDVSDLDQDAKADLQVTLIVAICVKLAGERDEVTESALKQVVSEFWRLIKHDEQLVLEPNLWVSFLTFLR